MTFFARPNLDDVQFRQLTGTTLTLSGQTKIATTTGLALSNGSGGTIVINAKGSNVVGNVMTFDGSEIRLMPSQGGSGGTSMYNPPYRTPASITLGGISGGTTLTGRTISSILEELLVPTINPTLTAPYSIFSITPSTSPLEVGVSVSLTGTITSFNRGAITPQYTSASPYRSGPLIAYSFSQFGLPPTTGVSNSCVFSPYTLIYPVNTSYACVYYSAGVQPKNSSGGNYSTPLVAGSTNNTCPSALVEQTIVAYYPYYWGKFTYSGPAGVGRPTASFIKSVITGGTGICTKVIGSSTGTLNINFGSTGDQYLWFATPVTGGAPKTVWFIDALNTGSIGGVVSPGGNLFPAYDVVTNVRSSTPILWNGQTYNIYISNYQTASTSMMQLRNS